MPHEPAAARRRASRPASCETHTRALRLSRRSVVSIISFGASGLGGMFTAGKGSGLTDAQAGAGDVEDVWFAEDADEDKANAKDFQ